MIHPEILQKTKSKSLSSGPLLMKPLINYALKQQYHQECSLNQHGQHSLCKNLMPLKKLRHSDKKNSFIPVIRESKADLQSTKAQEWSNLLKKELEKILQYKNQAIEVSKQIAKQNDINKTLKQLIQTFTEETQQVKCRSKLKQQGQNSEQSLCKWKKLQRGVSKNKTDEETEYAIEKMHQKFLNNYTLKIDTIKSSIEILKKSVEQYRKERALSSESAHKLSKDIKRKQDEFRFTLLKRVNQTYELMRDPEFNKENIMNQYQQVKRSISMLKFIFTPDYNRQAFHGPSDISVTQISQSDNHSQIDIEKVARISCRLNTNIRRKSYKNLTRIPNFAKSQFVFNSNSSTSTITRSRQNKKTDLHFINSPQFLEEYIASIYNRLNIPRKKCFQEFQQQMQKQSQHIAQSIDLISNKIGIVQEQIAQYRKKYELITLSQHDEINMTQKTIAPQSPQLRYQQLSLQQLWAQFLNHDSTKIVNQLMQAIKATSIQLQAAQISNNQVIYQIKKNAINNETAQQNNQKNKIMLQKVSNKCVTDQKQKTISVVNNKKINKQFQKQFTTQNNSKQRCLSQIICPIYKKTNVHRPLGERYTVNEKIPQPHPSLAKQEAHKNTKNINLSKCWTSTISMYNKLFLLQ